MIILFCILSLDFILLVVLDGVLVTAARNNEEIQPGEVCVRVDADCYIEDENNNLIDCGEFEDQPPLQVPLENNNCMRDIFVSGTVTNIFNTNVATSYYIDDGEATLSIINTGDSITIGNHYKEINICNIGAGEVDIFTIRVLAVWRPISSSSPIECKEEHMNFVLVVPQAISDHPSMSPSEQLSDHPSSYPTELSSGYPSTEDESKAESVHPSSKPIVEVSEYPSISPTELFSSIPSSTSTRSYQEVLPSKSPIVTQTPAQAPAISHSTLFPTNNKSPTLSAEIPNGESSR